MFKFTGNIGVLKNGHVTWEQAADIVVFAPTKKEAVEKTMSMLGEPVALAEWAVVWSRIEEVV